jgi:RNA 3'-terminal phosphate cyclase (ATP)
MTQEITIDGSYAEGGGQMLRTSMGLAAALWWRQGAAQAPRTLRIFNIRAGREKPGLRPQHAAAARAIAAVSGGTIQGAEIGSREVLFQPGRPRAGLYSFGVSTAGSTPLILQTILPALLMAEGDSEILLTGGTHNPLAPCFEYVRDVFCPLAAAANASFSAVMEHCGFYPAGGGVVRCRVGGLGGPEHLQPIRLAQRGRLKSVQGVSALSESLPRHILDRQAARAIARLEQRGIAGRMLEGRYRTASPGTYLFLSAVFQNSVAGFTALGRRGVPAERVADEAVDGLFAFLDSPGALDPHAADQLLTLLALCPRGSEFTTSRITPHLVSLQYVIGQVLGREVRIEGELNVPGKVILSQVNH